MTSTKTAAGHALAARGGDGTARPVNRDCRGPGRCANYLWRRPQIAAGILVAYDDGGCQVTSLPGIRWPSGCREVYTEQVQPAARARAPGATLARHGRGRI